MSTPVDVTYTPTEADRLTALKVLGWSRREMWNAMCGPWVPPPGYDRAYEIVLEDLQNAWDRYTERVANR